MPFAVSGSGPATRLRRPATVPCRRAAPTRSRDIHDFDRIIEAARRGDERAWGALYRGLTPALRGYVRSLGFADPDDLLGEVWLQVARNLAGFSGTYDGFRSWVFVIAHHRVIDERRRRSRQPADPIGDDVPDDWAGTTPPAEVDAEALLGTDEVVELLGSLTDEQREVLALRIIGDLTIDQVASVVGKRPGAVKALQRRALRTLRRILTQAVPL